MTKSLLLTVIIVAALARTASAGQPAASGITAERLTVRDGLSSNIVSCMVQDGLGYVWIATYNGLNAYDGYAVTSYPTPQGSGSGPAPIVGIQEDAARGVLWLTASNGRKSCFSLTERRYMADPGCPPESGRGGSVFAYFSGITYRNNGDGTVTRTDMHSAPKTMRLLPRAILDYTGQDHFHAVRLADGREAISTYGAGLFLYDPDAGTLAQFTAANSPGIIGSDYITALMADRSGCLWIAEDYTGLAILRFSGLRHTRMVAEPEAAIPDKNYVRHIADMGGRRLLVANNYGTCHVYDTRSCAFADAGYSGAKVYCTLTDSRGRRWTGTRGGGLYVDGRLLTTANSTLPSMDIYDIVEDRDGNVWVATLGGGVARAETSADGTLSFCPYLNNGSATAKAHDIEQAPDGRLWVATEGGLCVAEPGGEAHFAVYGSHDGTLPCDYFICLRADVRGNVWAGTVGGGLLRCSAGSRGLRYEAYTTHRGLAANDVNAISIDSVGRVWAGTEYGLSCVNPATNSVSNYFLAANPLGDAYSENACITLADGSMVFGTHLGVVRVWPGRPAARRTAHRTLITSVTINGDSGDGLPTVPAYGKPLATAYNRNTLSFSFSNFRYSDIRSVQYQCYLEGLENTWRPPTGSNIVTYTKLPPGEYRLHVRSNDGQGNWGDEATMTITVDQPWWNSAAAWVSYVLAALAVAVVTALTLRRIWALRKRLVVERSVTEHKINFFANVTHELTLPLMLIRAAADQIVGAGSERPSPATMRMIVANAARLSHMVEAVMQFRKMSKARLKPTLRRGDFVATVRSASRAFWAVASERGVRIRVIPFANSHGACFDADMVETVVGNLVSNAVKHSPDGGEVTVVVGRAGGRLTVDVLDDGPGVADGDRLRLFAPYTGMKTGKGGLGMGLYISRQAALAMDGDLEYGRTDSHRTLFRFTMPDITPAATATGASEGGQERATDSCRTAVYIKDMMPVPMNPDITVVIVEEDGETLNYLRFSLGQYFTTVAASGTDGALRAAIDADAHLVLAEKSARTDGMAIAKAVREERGQATRTIIMTADDSDGLRLRAVRAGVDGVLVRPFTVKMLTETCLRSVRDATEWRAMARMAKACGHGHAPDKAVITKEAERRFIDAFNQILADHAADAAFSADRFAELMGMGRGRFYRLTGKLTGETPATHILRARMEHVAQMLRDTGKPVKEIMAEAGFANPTHFYNTFKKYYGMSPRQYRITHRPL